MDFAITMNGFVPLYIFMLAGFAGWVIIGARAGNPAHAADVGVQLRSRHRRGRRDLRLAERELGD